jgi:hypothetical protein
MKNKECFECGKPATEEHHVIPESLGGTKTVPLCGGCHALVHGGYNKRRDDHIELTKAGIQRARERGVALGNRTNLSEAQALSRQAIIETADNFAIQIYEIVSPLKESGMGLQAIADYLNTTGVKTQRGGRWYTSTVCHIFKRVKKLQNDESGSTPIEQSTSHPEASGSLVH